MRYLFGFLLFLYSIDLFAQQDILFPDYPINWKDSARLDIDANEDYKTFRVFDSALDHNVFVVGENHHFSKSNAKFQLKLFKYLHKKAGVNTLLLEFGHSRGWLVNKYIATGDTNLLNILDQYSFASYTRFYKGLREYQEEIGNTDSIHVAGIDVERFHGLSLRILDELLPKEKDIPDKIRVTVESIHGLSAYNDHLYRQQEDARKLRLMHKKDRQATYDLEHSIEEIINSFNQYQSEFESYLGDNFEIFYEIIKDLEDKATYNEYVKKGMIQQYTFREDYMYRKFMQLYEQDTTRKFMMQFGRCHATLSTQEEACGWYKFNAIAKRIAETRRPGLQNRVSTIGIFYPKSDSFESNQKKYKQVRRMNNTVADQSLTLFSLIPDSTVTPEIDISNQFQFIVINNLDPRKELDEKYFIERQDEDAPTDDLKLHLKFNVGHFERNFGALNSFLLDNGFQGQWLPELTYGFGIAFEQTNGFCFSWDHFIYENFNSTNSVGESVDLSGYTTLFHYGRNFSKSEWFSLTPYIGWGVGRTKLIYDSGTQQGSLFGEQNTKEYTNPGLLADAMLSAKVNIKFMSIGVEGGYIVDFSNPKWRANGENVSESVGQRHSGYFVTGTFTFYL